jgi:hypothetical protein
VLLLLLLRVLLLPQGVWSEVYGLPLGLAAEASAPGADGAQADE